MVSGAHRIARIPVVGPILLALYRLRIALRPVGRAVRGAIRWWWCSREVTNFTYELTAANERQLAAFVAPIASASLARVRAYMDELASDDALRSHLREATLALPGAAMADPEPRYGRRLGWYALVRLLKPRIVVETGVDKGLGACVLAAALARNTVEGHPGEYIGIDLNPAAGSLFGGPYERFGRILYGDSLERLREIKSIDFFVHDSDHSAEHEACEYELIEQQLSEGAVVLSDNAHVTDRLLEFSMRTKRRYLFFQERPYDHWYPGGGIGVAFP